MSHTSRLRSALHVGAAAAAFVALSPEISLAQSRPVAAPPVPAPGAAPAQDLNSGGIQTVIVTAEKREANIQNVPVAVTAFTSKERALEGINTVQDITNFTPGLVYSSQLDRPAIRGLSRNSNIYTQDSSVGVYDNDLFTNSTFLVGRDDMIVDQVEVLEGPQNTLYGRNAIGGIINTVSKRPSRTFGGEIREEFGNYGVNKIEATVTGPLTFINPNLLFRFSGYYDEQDKGWFKNVAGKDIGGVRHDPYEELQLEYKTERDDIWFMTYNLNFFHDRGGPGSLLSAPSTGPYDTALTDANRNAGTSLYYNPNFPYSGGAVPGSVVGQVVPGNPTTLKNRIIAERYNTDINVDDAYSFNFHWTHHFDGVDVKYVGGYSQYHYANPQQAANYGDSPLVSYQIPVYPLAAVPVTSGNLCGYLNAVGGACSPLTVDAVQSYTYEALPQWYSHEVDVTSTTNGPLSWIAGVYYFNERDNNLVTLKAPTQPQLLTGTWNVIPVSGAAGYIPTLLTGGTPQLAINNPSQSSDYSYQNYQGIVQSAAVFGQASYKITPTLKFTGGLRYSNDQKKAQEEVRYISFANLEPAQLLGQFTPAVDLTPGIISYAGGPGVKTPTSFPTTGKYAGDAVRNLAAHSDAITGTAALEWTPDRDTLAYARYNRGYKAVALNAGEDFPIALAKPEFVNDYELGLKETFGRVFEFDLAAFYYDYTNDQIPLGIPTATPVGPLAESQFINIPKAVSDGVELETRWSPIRNLNLSVNYSYDHTEILSGCPTYANPAQANVSSCFINPIDPFAQAPGAKPAGPTAVGEIAQNVKGNALPQAPENKIAFNATYTLNFDPGDLILSGSYVWRDHSYYSIFRSNLFDYAPSWSQVDMRATWSGDHDRYEIVAYVKNLFNTIGYDAAFEGLYNAAPQGGGSPTYNPVYDVTPPRLYGMELHLKF